MNDPVVFEDWETVLKAEVPPDRHRSYREAIVKFRYWLRETGKQPVVETFKEHLAWKQSYLSPERFAIRREALRWYYKIGMERMWERAVPRGPAGARTPEAKGDISGDGVRLASVTPAQAREASKRGDGCQTRGATLAGRAAHGADAKPMLPWGVLSAREPPMDGYRVYDMNDVETTRVCTHVLNRPGVSVENPFDCL